MTKFYLAIELFQVIHKVERNSNVVKRMLINNKLWRSPGGASNLSAASTTGRKVSCARETQPRPSAVRPRAVQLPKCLRMCSPPATHAIQFREQHDGEAEPDVLFHSLHFNLKSCTWPLATTQAAWTLTYWLDNCSETVTRARDAQTHNHKWQIWSLLREF